MIIFFTFLSFGLLFVNRIVQIQLNRKTLPEAILKSTIKKIILFFWMIVCFSPWTPVLISLFFVILLLFVVFRLEFILNIILRRQFIPNMLQFLDELTLLMTSGKSFNESFRTITLNSNHYFHIKLREINTVQLLNVHSPTISQKEFSLFNQILYLIDKNPHLAVEKIKSYRRLLHIQYVFKKKLQQKSYQIKVQALILSFLYFGLLIFLNFNHTKIAISHLGLSLTLFFSGLLSLYLIGRDTKWKT